MGKTSATIKLIQILSSRSDYISSNDLAELLETNPRNIKEYIKEIEECGYVVESLKGVYGGYRLNRASTMPSLKLSIEEKEALQKAHEYLLKCEDCDHNLTMAIGKVLSDINVNNMVTPSTMVDRFPLSMDKAELQKRYGLFSEAIDNLLKVDISYKGAKGNVKNHIIHPYKIFVYNGSWFLLAFNETVNDIGYFKFSRIDDLFVTRNHFTIMKSYNESDYLDEYSMKSNVEYFHIELEISNMNNVMQERIFGKNQKLEIIDKNHLIFKCDMQSKEMITSFVLSLGKNCKIIEPEWLLNNVRENLEKMIENYE